jgi:prophage DNA circulation protein
MTDILATVLQEGAYEGVIFPVDTAQTDGGNDAVRHKAYGRRGADIEPTGQKEYEGTLTIPLINDLHGYGGNLFTGTYFDLLSKFETKPIGQLSHPSKGTFTALIESWSEELAPDRRNGVVLHVKWVEHNAQAGILLSDQGSTPADAPTAATANATAADANMAAASQSGGYTLMSPIITTQLAFLESAPRTVNEISAAFAAMLSPIATNLALLVFSPAAAHPAVASLEALRATVLLLRDRYLNGFARFRSYVVPTTTSVWQIAITVYGDASKSSLITAANAINDPLYVRAGTVLTILPVQ